MLLAILLTCSRYDEMACKASENRLQSIRDQRKVLLELKKINQLRINSDNFGDQGYNPEAVGAFFSMNVGELSSPSFYNNGVFIFHKTNESKINYPSNYNRYQGLIEKKYQADVDLLLVDILKKDKKIIDNRFNFY